jgi:hypothetical protein
MRDVISPVHSHWNNHIANLWTFRWIKWSLHTTYSIICTNLILPSFSVVLLLSTVARCTQDGSLDDAVNHYRQPPVHSDRRYVSLGDIAETLLSTRIACHWAIILKAISLSFRYDHFTSTCMPSCLVSLYLGPPRVLWLTCWGGGGDATWAGHKGDQLKKWGNKKCLHILIGRLNETD